MATIREILNELRTKPTTSVPNTGKVLGDIGPNPSYEAAKNGTLGVPTFWVGGKLRVASIDVLRKLGLEDEADFAEVEQQTEQLAEVPSPPATCAPQPRTRKAPVTGAAHKSSKSSKSKHQETAEIA
jgi:hypothetical protein